MSNLSEDIEIKVSTNAAQHFVDSYYPALNTANGRATLATFYIQPTPTAPLQADISLNGNILATPAELQALFENQVAEAYYEVQSFDCQVLNPNYNIGAPESMLGPDKDGKKMSILVLVSGYVRYGKKDMPMRGFTENIVLVPNWEALGPMTIKGVKRWLIQSQNSRLVV